MRGHYGSKGVCLQEKEDKLVDWLIGQPLSRLLLPFSLSIAHIGAIRRHRAADQRRPHRMIADGHLPPPQADDSNLSAAPLKFLPYEAESNEPLCLACGASLMGLRNDRRCTGCGLPAGRSVQGNLLRYAEPQYVRQLARGTMLILWGLLAAVAGAIAACVLVRLVHMPRWLIPAVILLGSLVVVAGNWMASGADPGPLSRSWAWKTRTLLRILVVLGLGRSLWDIATAWGQHAGPDGQTPVASLTVAGVLLTALLWAGWVMQCVYYRRLAKRLADRHLALYTQIVMWSIVAAVTVMFLAVVLGVPVLLELVGPTPDSPIPDGALIAPYLCALVLVFLMIWWAGLLFLYRRQFLDQAAWAEKSWYHDNGAVSVFVRPVEEKHTAAAAHSAATRKKKGSA
jgi:hypothetical protein